ncbi:type II toxin-antitoxin system Phd/YefM family antitoxin [Rothia aerolata]|nr:type II toxin-antitoxin system Phd/YefM family antitoxin [Rothia aerolata]
MATLTNTVSTRELRGDLSDVLSRAKYGNERIGITRNGKLTAVLVSVEDLEALEAYELQQDSLAYEEAQAEDDGERTILQDFKAELGL